LKNSLLILCSPKIQPAQIESLALSHRFKQPIIITRKNGQIKQRSTMLKLEAVNFFSDSGQRDHKFARVRTARKFTDKNG
jgi:hypothetical protein